MGVISDYMARQRAIEAAALAGASAPAPASGTVAGGAVPTAGQVSRIMASEVLSYQYVIQTTDVIEECFAHIECRVGLIYVCASVSNGALVDPSADVYIGRTRQHLTEIRGDATIPVLLNDSSTGEPQSARTYVRGAAGTIVLLKYR